MAHPDTLKAHAKSRFKRGLVTPRQHNASATPVSAGGEPNPANAQVLA